MKLIKIDLTEQLGEGQYIEIRDPKHLPWGEQKKMLAAMKDDTVESRLSFAENLVISLVRNGNIIDEDGNPIILPLTADTIELIPADIIEVVSEEFRKSKAKGADVPKQ